nr:leucine rich repeat containing protein 67 [Hymenolepis microstoma]
MSSVPFNHLARILSGNKIAVLEGLTSQIKLRELRIDHQRLAAGEGIIVDPRSAQSLKALRYLDISRSGLNCLDGLEHLTNLESLDLRSNRLFNESELINYLSQAPNLKDLSIAGNPFSKTPRINEKIIVSARNLEILNGKEIPASRRKFTEGWLLRRSLPEKTQQSL